MKALVATHTKLMVKRSRHGIVSPQAGQYERRRITHRQPFVARIRQLGRVWVKPHREARGLRQQGTES